jgi:pyridoxamine 5'-phosphate oxidase
MDLSGIRREYVHKALDESDAATDPIEQFQRWLAEAVAADPQDFTSMTLATADRTGRPSARIVLLKGVDARGFVFYTNYGSDKAKDLEENPRAALVFYWSAFERQVRVEGTAERTTREESEAYFHSRPRRSQVGATISPQSRVIGGRQELERKVAEMEERLAGAEVPLPETWGGYRVRPETVEFWQGRRDRLHDRLVYRRQAESIGGGWTIERLAP